MLLKSKNTILRTLLPFAVIALCGLFCCCNKAETSSETVIGTAETDISWEDISEDYLNESEDKSQSEETDQGYDLPVNESERKEAEEDCRKVMGYIENIYLQADKGEASNVVLANEPLLQMKTTLGETGCPVTAVVTYSDMENYEVMDSFLNSCREGIEGSVILYEVRSHGGIGRKKYQFDGKNLYVLSSDAAWNVKNQPVISYISYTRLKKWDYTEKGWFCYELCVPEESEVSEVVDGSHMVRVKPLGEENRRMSELCVEKVGYQGNNLLCSDWDTEHMDKLDYNGIYEYLYQMKYQKKYCPEENQTGIPADEFESLLMEYLPVTAEQIRSWAVYDPETESYGWADLGFANGALSFLGNSFPEVTDIQDNGEGTITLIVDAVCEKVQCNEAFITHELTVRFADDGSFQYVGNKVLGNGLDKMPEYQYRMGNQS
ncbi:MAG: DUF6070 family protein [Eubacterium sp.]|nr:DUF6070 family protein [Eubacterium sp.]